jgi:hypothetical protein
MKVNEEHESGIHGQDEIQNSSKCLPIVLAVVDT